MTPQQLQEFNRLYEKYQGLNMSAEEASRKAIRDMTQKGLLKPQGGRRPVPKLTKGDWFQQLKATGSVTSSSAAGGGPSNSATTEGISFIDSQGNPSLRFGKKKRRKKNGKNKERC